MNLPPTACLTPGCSGYSEVNGKCSVCSGGLSGAPAQTPEEKHDYHREWKKLYNCVRWKRLRDAILRREPICRLCKRNPSTIADHIIDHRGVIALFYDPKNLQGLCKECHDDKTGSMHGGGNRPAPFKPALENGMIRDYALEHK